MKFFITILVFSFFIGLIVLCNKLVTSSNRKHRNKKYDNFISTAKKGELVVPADLFFDKMTPVGNYPKNTCCFIGKWVCYETIINTNRRRVSQLIGKINGKWAIHYIPTYYSRDYNILGVNVLNTEKRYRVYYRPVEKLEYDIEIDSEKIEYEFVFEDLEFYENAVC